jgi:hypothetical protein
MLGLEHFCPKDLHRTLANGFIAAAYTRLSSAACSVTPTLRCPTGFTRKAMSSRSLAWSDALQGAKRPGKRRPANG